MQHWQSIRICIARLLTFHFTFSKRARMLHFILNCMMCWFLTDKFLACWLQIYFYKIDAYVNHHSLALCLLSTHLLTNKKVCRQPIDQLFFKAERNYSLTLSLFFIYSCSWKSRVMRTARLHDITTNTASIDSSVILNQCPSHGITLFFSVQNTVQSEWWPVQQFSRLFTYCCSYLSKILYYETVSLFFGIHFCSYTVQFYFS